jgi:DNA-binding MarR family transcriptional regulator
MYLTIQPGRTASIGEIAERYNISRNHLVKVVHNLARGGFIKRARISESYFSAPAFHRERCRCLGQLLISQRMRYSFSFFSR